ncbi:hypothetical protein GCM10009577_01820 [Streptomyces javensis]
MLVVADQTPVQHQDPVGLLDPPPLRLRREPLVLRVAFDDLDVNPQACTVQDHLLLEALVNQCLADGSAGVPGDLVQQDDARGVVVRVRSEDDDCDNQAEDVHGQSALAARRPLGRIPAGRGGGDPAAAWTLWVSRTTRVGSSNRRARSRTWQRRSSWMTWSVPSIAFTISRIS